MNPTFPTPPQVIADFGDSFFNALLDAVTGAANDLELHRNEHPVWAATYSARYVANFLHERIWGRMLPTLEGDDRITINGKDPHREFIVGYTYRARFKRHLPDESVSNFPTDGSIEFWGGGRTLEGLEQLSLALGYRWDPASGIIEAPVFSLRESAGKALWVEELYRDTGTAVPRIVSRPTPDAPQFGLGDLAEELARGQA